MTKTMTTNMSVTAVDIPTMTDMSASEYEAYLDGGLIYIDHHGNLRSAVADYPLACTGPQVEALIAYLETLKAKVGE